jgi:predicted TIM-barrel fold metal-dependent hydrolase
MARKPAGAKMKMDWAIDSDSHITEPGDVWTSRVPARLRAQAPRIVRNPQTGLDVWQVGDRQMLMPVGHTAVAGWKAPFPSAPRNMDEVPPASHDAKARLAYMDEIGVWAQALYPNVGGFGNQEFLKLGDPELMLACVRAYNDFVLDWIEPDPRRFIPIMATPFWDVPAAVAEIQRCAARGHKGILFTGEPQRHGLPILGDPHWEPLWSAAEDTGLPVSFHIGSGSFTEDFSPERMRTHGIGPTLCRTTVSLFLDNGKQIVDLLFSGVLPRHPGLRVVSVESGIGFLPFVLEAADYCFGYSQVRRERPEYTLLPSEYFRRQVYGCYFFEEVAPQRLIDKIGADNILFETDYPHPVCLFGNVREKIEASLAGQPVEVRRKLLFDNAARLYGVQQPDAPPTA